MSRIKKSTAACTVLAIALVGCGNGESSQDEPENIVYWLWQDDPSDDTWNELVEEFNEEQDEVNVTVETIPLDQYQNQIVTAVTSGSGPDAARSKDWWMGDLAPEGATADLTPFISEWGESDDVVDSLWASGQIPGQDEVYMLPHQYTTMYLYYRKDIFEELNLRAPKTQEEFIDALETLQEDDQYGIDVRGGAGGQDQWLAWMYAGGAEVVNEQGEVVLDDPLAVEVNQRYLDIVGEASAAPPGSISAAFAEVQTNFADGLTAMMIHHPGSLQTMEDEFGEDLGVMPIPTDNGEEGTTLGTMSGNMIMNDSDKQEAAWAWISWLSEREQIEKMSSSSEGQLPVLESVLATDDYQSDDNLSVAVEAIPHAKTWPAVEGVSQLADMEWSPSIQRAFQGELTSEEVLERLANLIRE